jgi:hypothetical protein
MTQPTARPMSGEIWNRAIEERRADLYEKQAAFYEARADQAAHTAVAAAFFRREAARIRRQLGARAFLEEK